MIIRYSHISVRQGDVMDGWLLIIGISQVLFGSLVLLISIIFVLESVHIDYKILETEIICSISVMVTHQPHKVTLMVRIRYATPSRVYQFSRINKKNGGTCTPLSERQFGNILGKMLLAPREDEEYSEM